MTENFMQAMFNSSHISGGSVAYVDALYEKYLKDPYSVATEWRRYFEDLPQVAGQVEVSHADIRHYFLEQAKLGGFAPVAAAPSPEGAEQRRRQAHVLQLINAYRSHGHHQAKLDPLEMTKRPQVPDLTLAHHQLTEGDLGTSFSTESTLTHNSAPLRDIQAALERTYCGSIGIEYMHISDDEETTWLKERMESVQGHPDYAPDIKRKILSQLTAAEGLEKYLGTKYVGQKRFSLEGAESLIPLLDELVRRAGGQGVKELVIGMAHRGRLNVLINILGKAPNELFQEFEGKFSDEIRSGDVKYHLGFSSDIVTPGGTLHLTLAFNPSHLEIIAPVVEGSVRARQRRRGDVEDKKEVMPIIIHGDAAFAAQGVVMETFNFSQARGYATGGTVHLVINNQIGFTTSNPLDSRSTLYCTDVAKMVNENK